MALSGLVSKDKSVLLFDDEKCSTHTSKEQIKVEQSVLRNYEAYIDCCDDWTRIPLLRHKHVAFLKKGLSHLSESYECLDASRPWICYWILQGLALLDEPIPEEVASKIAGFLDKCQDPDGGFAGDEKLIELYKEKFYTKAYFFPLTAKGGPGQMPHLATTYAAVCALCILGKDYTEAYNIINRKTLQKFLYERKTDSGGFTVHKDGEVDIRGAYCAIVAARLTNIVTPDLFKNTADWIVTCQTYEGGFGGYPGLEAHGGYSFCGFASLALLGQEQKANMKNLLRWASRRQMKFEGGFQGRTNKLVDGCYSFWQGGLFPIVHNILAMYSDEDLSQERWMFDHVALQEYILINCQYPGGGLIDKPGKSRDYYHTCYCLSGLSVAQNFAIDSNETTSIIGGQSNLLKATHPAYNVTTECAFSALDYFITLPIPTLGTD